ncbi:acyltransferase family protein [Austwickia chelonae]|uniref:acyltransferase family protein n=1 Tax=Austwickia chelonae TaxID=100225 RepID=UPI000E245FCE|nr:acyltransferase family protein [Austwickia chelonae]
MARDLCRPLHLLIAAARRPTARSGVLHLPVQGRDVELPSDRGLSPEVVPSTAQTTGLVPAGRRERMPWVDAARGAVVMMVVLMHVGLYHYLPMVEGRRAADFWTGVNSVLQVVRMPALLVISGWLASSRIREGLCSRRTRRSIIANAYLYALWLALYTLAAVALHATTMAHAPAPSTFAVQLLVPYSTLWFLAGLCWYTLILSALRRLPPALVLGALFAIGWTSSLIWSVENGLWANIPHLAFFFGVGVYARQGMALVNRHPGRSALLSIAAASLSVRIARGLTQLGLAEYAFHTFTALAGVTAVFAAACLIAQFAARSTRLLAWMGRRTLPVYTLHYLAVMALSSVESGPLYELDRALLASESGVWMYPLVVTAAIIVLSVTVKEVADRICLSWLFAMPRVSSFRLFWARHTPAIRSTGHPRALRPVRLRLEGRR